MNYADGDEDSLFLAKGVERVRILLPLDEEFEAPTPSGLEELADRMLDEWRSKKHDRGALLLLSSFKLAALENLGYVGESQEELRQVWHQREHEGGYSDIAHGVSVHDGQP